MSSIVLLADNSPGDPQVQWGWTRLVPLKFHRVSGLRKHKFRTVLPNGTWEISQAEKYGVIKIGIVHQEQLTEFTVSKAKFPDVLEAILLIGSVDDETVREKRYLAIHSAYECLVSPREIDLTAIRHALAHPPNQLSDPRVVKSLTERFGGLKIDLRSYDHQKEFYRSLGQLLIRIDFAICRKLCEDTAQQLAAPELASR